MFGCCDGAGTGMTQADRDRVIWLQWRLMEDKTIKAAKIVLLEDLLAKKLGLVKAPPPKVPGWAKPPLLRYTFMLKFIAKVFGPVARNNAQYRQTLQDATKKAQERAAQLQAASAFVKLQKKTLGGVGAVGSAGSANNDTDAAAMLTAGSGFQRALARARSSSRLANSRSQPAPSEGEDIDNTAANTGGFEAQPPSAPKPSTPQPRTRPRRSRVRRNEKTVKESEGLQGDGGVLENGEERTDRERSSRATGEVRKSEKSKRTNKSRSRSKDKSRELPTKEANAELLKVAP